MAPTSREPDTSQISHQMDVASSRTSSRPSARRLPSGGWGRLRAPQVDPLSVYGLPSKGETRLNDSKNQEAYYRKIVDRWMKFCATAGSGDKLEAAFRSMTISQPLNLRGNPTASSSASHALHPAQASTSSLPAPTSTWDDIPTPSTFPPMPQVTEAQRTELAIILSAMRKLRESLTATSRADGFAQRAYLFILRATLLTRSWEAYAPCMTALLSRIQRSSPLAASELRDVVGWTVLDTACRVGDVHGALALRQRWCGDALLGGGGRKVARDRNVDLVLRALVRDDWILWRAAWRSVDGYGRALMAFAEERMRLHTLKVVGRAYLRIERGTLERWTGKRWDELVAEGVGWELDEGGGGGGEGPPGEQWVTVRRIKGRA